MMFRKLKASEIEARVGSVYKDGITLLLYKDARCDMKILDETFTPANWQRKHYECKGNLFCSVGVYIESRSEWVWKDDCGTESKTEKEKGEASDSFKRACFNWGIGRELYTAPFIWIDRSKVQFTEDGKVKTKFAVADIEISDLDDGSYVITKLLITDSKGNEMFNKGYPKGKQEKQEQPKYHYFCEECSEVIPDDVDMNKMKAATIKEFGEEKIVCRECFSKLKAAKNGN